MNYRDEYRQVEREAFWTAPRAMVGLLAIVVIVYLIGFVATGGDYFLYRFWAPKQENVRRQVFENTQSYVEGKIGYLTRLRSQYSVADGSQKAALRTLILDEASTVDNSKLPEDLQLFIDKLKGEIQ